MVWYASYGSNLLYEKGFKCYIQGGIRQGRSEKEDGCRDKTPPQTNKPIDIPYKLYFAGESNKWNKGGVAFIGHGSIKDNKNLTFGRMYLITEEQFRDVVKQENGNKSIVIDFEKVKSKGSINLREPWYGRIVYIGDEENYPIFTFTNYKDLNEQKINKPSCEYIRIIASGLKETKKNWDKEDVINYLIEKPGIKGNYSKEDLIKII